MLFYASAKNQDIIKINNDKLIKERMKYLVHESHEGARSVGKPKWHHKPFKEAFISFECCLLFISGPDSDLVIATP